MSQIQLGPLSGWVSGLLSFVSILLALYILRRDQRREERALPSKIACWLDGDFMYLKAHLHNHADVPIIMPQIAALPKPAWLMWWFYLRLDEEERTGSYRRAVAVHSITSFQGDALFGQERTKLVKGGEDVEGGLMLELGLSSYDFSVGFYDTTGRRWMRSMGDGKVFSARKMKSFDRRRKRVSVAMTKYPLVARLRSPLVAR
ncbi:hypothetical protein CH292_13400 [Rhodococcus sp. 14-2470-1a]|nr:hypothetical protein CH292_13400 [Rhodococcus sp. 14-2470-1a]